MLFYIFTILLSGMTPPREPLQMNVYSLPTSRRLLFPVIQSWCQHFPDSETLDQVQEAKGRPTPAEEGRGRVSQGQEVDLLSIRLSTAWTLVFSLQTWQSSCIISRNKKVKNVNCFHRILGHDRMSNDYYSTGVSCGGQHREHTASCTDDVTELL